MNWPQNSPESVGQLQPDISWPNNATFKLRVSVSRCHIDRSLRCVARSACRRRRRRRAARVRSSSISRSPRADGTRAWRHRCPVKPAPVPTAFVRSAEGPCNKRPEKKRVPVCLKSRSRPKEKVYKSIDRFGNVRSIVALWIISCRTGHPSGPSVFPGFWYLLQALSTLLGCFKFQTVQGTCS